MGLGAQPHVSSLDLVLPPLVGPQHGVVPVLLARSRLGLGLGFIGKSELVGRIFNQCYNRREVLEVVAGDETNDLVDDILGREVGLNLLVVVLLGVVGTSYSFNTRGLIAFGLNQQVTLHLEVQC